MPPAEEKREVPLATLLLIILFLLLLPSCWVHIIFHIFFLILLFPLLLSPKAQLAVGHPFVRIMRRCQIAKRTKDWGPRTEDCVLCGVHKSETSEWFEGVGTRRSAEHLFSTLSVPGTCPAPLSWLTSVAQLGDQSMATAFPSTSLYYQVQVQRGEGGRGVASGSLKSVDFLIKMQNVIWVVNSNRNDTIDNDNDNDKGKCRRVCAAHWSMKPNIISWAWSPLVLPPVVIGANGMQTTTAITAAVGGVGGAE